jgi:hypothetical protein
VEISIEGAADEQERDAKRVKTDVTLEVAVAPVECQESAVVGVEQMDIVIRPETPTTASSDAVSPAAAPSKADEVASQPTDAIACASATDAASAHQIT